MKRGVSQVVKLGLLQSACTANPGANLKRTLALAERAKGVDSILPLARLPHVMFFGGGVPIKLGDETIGAIGASGAPGGKLDDACARAGLGKIKDRLQ